MLVASLKNVRSIVQKTYFFTMPLTNATERHLEDILESITSLSLQMNNASNLIDMLNIAVQQTREILGGDRALIYQFLRDGDGVVMAESVAKGWKSILGELIGDPCFTPKYAQLYQEGKFSVIEDTHTKPMEPCYADLLARMQVRANLVMPILVGSQPSAPLFGLLIVHQCDRPRQWQPLEINLLRNIATQLGITLGSLAKFQPLCETPTKITLQINQPASYLLASCQTEQEPLWQEALLQAMSETSPLAFFVVDNRTDNILYFNHYFCEVWNIEHLEERMQRGELKNNDIIPDCIPLIADLPAFIESCKPLQSEENRIVIEDEIQFIDQRIIRRFSKQIRDRQDRYFGRLYIFEDITERKLIESTTKANAEREQYALEGSGEGVWDWNVQTNEVFFSPRWKDILGFEDSEIKNDFSEWDIRLHPEDRKNAYAEIERHLRGETKQYEIEHRLQCKDGSYKWILARAQILSRTPDGAPLRFAGTHVDISDRKRAELEIQHSEAKYRHLIDNLHAGFVVHASDTSILLANSNACQLLGLTLDQMLGKTAIDPAWHFAHEDGTVMTLEDYPVNRVLKTGLPLKNYVLRINRSDHSQVWILVNAFPEFDANQKIQQITISFLDISDRKQAEGELKKISNRLALSLKSGAIGCWDWDISQSIILWDDRMYDLYEVKKQSDFVSYDVWSNSVHPDDRNYAETSLQQAVLGHAEYDIEFRVIHPDRSIHFIKAYGTVVRDVHGNPQSMIGINFDVTDHKLIEIELAKAKQDAEAATKAKSKFLANMSHELRTPMNGVLGITELLAATNLTEEQQDFVQIIQHSGDTLLAIVNDILNFSKIEAGMMTLEAKEFGLDDVLSSICKLLNKQALDKQIQLDYAIASHLPSKFIGDSTRLHQILLNLIGNAIKFTQNGHVAIAIGGQSPNNKTEPYKLTFAVRDTGLGIQREYLAELFQAFTQADASISRKYGGTGLGLAITKRLVELMGGTIWAESLGHVGGNPPLNWLTTSDSQGSTFYFAIALFTNSEIHQLPKLDISALPIDAQMAEKFPLRILLVEDNLFNQKVASLTLNKLGYQTDIANNGLEALNIVQQKSYDLVLMDVQMPEMDGLTATKLIRRNLTYYPWIVAMTANVLPEDRQACFEAGMNDYLSKPFKIQDIVQIFSTYIQNKEDEPTLLNF